MFLCFRSRICARLTACRQKLQARAKELEKAKKAFLEAERHKRDKAAKESNKEMRVGSACLLGWLVVGWLLLGCCLRWL